MRVSKCLVLPLTSLVLWLPLAAAASPPAEARIGPCPFCDEDEEEVDEEPVDKMTDEDGTVWQGYISKDDPSRIIWIGSGPGTVTTK